MVATTRKIKANFIKVIIDEFNLKIFQLHI